MIVVSFFRHTSVLTAHLFEKNLCVLYKKNRMSEKKWEAE